MRFSYGQNMGWGHTNMSKCVDAWFEEYQDYAEKGVDPLVFRMEGDPERKSKGLGQATPYTYLRTQSDSKNAKNVVISWM
jgi:hypothetical protein